MDDIAAIQAEMDENIAITVNNTIVSFAVFCSPRVSRLCANSSPSLASEAGEIRYCNFYKRAGSGS